MPRKIEGTVTEDLAEERLDLILPKLFSEITRSQGKTLLESGAVFANSKPVSKASLKLKAGSVIEIHLPDPKALDLTPADLGLKILYEDEELAVLNKPSGLSVHPSDTENAPTLVHGLLHELKSLSSVGGVIRPGIVHRIDKGTSGLLVISKTDFTHHHLAAQFKAHSIQRVYMALVYGDLSKKGTSGTISTFYGRHPTQRKKMTGTLKTGRTAITHWKILEKFINATLVECKLETGRTHQIRVHLSELGFPVMGDPVYGAALKNSKKFLKTPALYQALTQLNHQLLHAKVLGFIHPRTGKELVFSSEPEKDFSGILELLRKA